MPEELEGSETMTIELLSWEARLILEGLAELEAKWRSINETSEDEDQVADTGNDLIQLGITKRRLEEEAVKTFGEQIKDFDNSSLI